MKLTWCLYENPVYDSTSPLVADLARHKLTGASFSTLAQGGFADGSLAFGEVSERFARNALENWLTKRVVATDGGGRIAYEGYVAQINATLNNTRMVRSIDPYANRLFVDYRYGGGSCPKGQTCKGRVQRNESNVAETITQTLYGIKEEWVDFSGYGVLTSGLATNIADIKLVGMLRARDYSFQISEPHKQPNELSLNLWGYYTTLQWRKQSRTFRKLTDIGTIVATALTSNSKAPFINGDQSQINTLSVTRKWNPEGRAMWLMDYIQGAIAEGDANGLQVEFQIWENRMPYLKSRSTAPRYFVRYDDMRVWDANRALIPPYMVRAGGFMISENMLESGIPFGDVTQRAHASYVERTTYDDIAEQLNVPHSGQLPTAERLLARARRLARRKV